MSEALYDLEAVHTRAAQVANVDPDQGLLEVKLAPYEVEAELGPGLAEVFTRGCFAAAVGNPSRVKVTDQQHNRSVVVGNAIELRDEADGIYGTLRIADTAAGRDILALTRGPNPVLDELSVEFRPQKRHAQFIRRRDDVLVRHDRAVLVGVSPVGAGAYGTDARVLSVRDAEADKRREQELAYWNAEPTWREHLPRA
jgi:HK97 family phage prohead protease